MGSLHRASFFCCYSRMWRTFSSCLHSPRPAVPRLVLMLVTIYALHSSQAKPYDHGPNNKVTYYTYNCSDWCGEPTNWSQPENRVLRYSYNVTDELVLQNTTIVVHENNCSGAQDSLDCESRTIVKTGEKIKRVVSIERSSKPDIKVMPPMNLYLITTDNINKSDNTSSDTYPINQDKIWQLKIPENCKMSVYFSRFDLEVSNACEKDSFSVQISKYRPDKGTKDFFYRYCNNLHKIVIKRRKRIQMTFHSDRAVARGGIKATVCLSNLHDAATEEELNEQLPCTCDSTKARRKKASRSSKTSILRQKIAEEDTRVKEWLHQLMEGGQEAVNSILQDPEHPKQRHLAEQYQDVLSKHREW